MYCVGLTGTIASGKSTVAAIFAKHGIHVISADHIARLLTSPGQPALQDIINHFGSSIITSSGELNRRKLRELIFKNTTDRIWLEELLHPLIRTKIEEEIKGKDALLCIIEIPLLTNLSHYPYLNRVLLILANHEQQIARLMSRDKNSEEQALAILATQASEEHYKSLADDVLINDESLDKLQEKTHKLISMYMDFSKKT
ncbi:MAG: dephospho-CoA kinase [Legionellaceae bacterium]|nr:dephospho-CoA kinase [Legionellaceae bacterium]